MAAKQGFGKTVLSTAAMEDLAATAEDPDAYTQPPSTAFFHFSFRKSECAQSEDAFRAIACQLLETHRYSRRTIDLVCLLLRKTTFRDHALIDEVLDTLSLLLRQHPTFLIFDGIDECGDVESLLTSLARICRKSDARVILFSRPNIRIPLEYQKWASDAPHILSLTHEHNAAAIQEYVTHGLNQLADQGFFGISMDRTLLLQVARISDGDFLWTSMMLRFLGSDVLTSDERHAMLKNIQSLKGLDLLYNMFGALARRSKQEKRVIADIFRWLSLSINQVAPSALLSALNTSKASSSGKPLMADIMRALPKLTCGLLQAEDDTVTFSHRSINEFLRSSMSESSEFSLYDESSAHAHLAADCLSYLAHDMPKQPLSFLQPPSASMLTAPSADSAASLRTSKSGDSGYKSLSSSEGDNNTTIPAVDTPHTPSNRTIPFDTHLPFLRYAALCWPIHLTRALSPQAQHTATTSYPFIPVLATFLSSRHAVTAWVETSFRYKLPPTLTRLVGPIWDLKGEISPATVKGMELRTVCSQIRELSERLVGLKREYEGVLRGNPSAVWQMDGVGGGANGDGYWPVWEDVGGGDGHG